MGQATATFDDLKSFLEGYTIFPETGAVHSARYISGRDQLQIIDQGLLEHWFEEITPQLAEEFFSSADKDEWLTRQYQSSYRAVDLGRPVTPVDIRVTAVPAHMQSFLRGLVRLHFTSSFGPVEALYGPAQDALECVFRSGFYCVYGPIPRWEVEALAASTSKGRWCHARLKLGYYPDRTWIHRYPIQRWQRLGNY